MKKEFFSLSMYPGKTGEYYYNSMFEKLNLPFTYSALACNNIEGGVKLMREKKAAGFSVSMPFKKEVSKYIDTIGLTAQYHKACNTVVLEDKSYVGYNTDYAGVEYIASYVIPITDKVFILGDGVMAQMFYKKLGDKAKIYSRKLNNWESRYQSYDTIINCTTFGTSTEESPFAFLPTSNIVIDLAIKSNRLQQQAKAANVKYIGGIEFYKRQFIEQFRIYTGIKLTMEDVEKL